MTLSSGDSMKPAGEQLPLTQEVTGKRQVLLVAGEASGDLHGADLVEALKRQAPEVEVFGVGGTRLREAGMQVLVDTAEVAGMGLVEMKDKLPALVRAYRLLKRILCSSPPDLLVLIDFPEFNLRLAKVAKRYGVPVLYYIGPQVWAWRQSRVHTMARWVDRLVVVFHFEPPWYAQAGCAAEFVGHPLVDRARPSRTRAETLLGCGLDPAKRTVVLLPGSRSQEVRYLLPRLLRAAEILGAGYQFVVAVAPTLAATDIETVVNKAAVQVQVVRGDTYNLVHAADLALVASGTATLETALLGRPMVIVYRMALLTYVLARLLVRVPFIGMPNLIAGRRVVPELVQGEATGERIAAEAKRILDTPAVREEMIAGLSEVRRQLGEGGAAARAAAVALRMLQGG